MFAIPLVQKYGFGGSTKETKVVVDRLLVREQHTTCDKRSH